MGNYLSSPDTKKHSVDGENAVLRFGTSAMQGWRVSMEDAHINDPHFAPNMSLFAIFDGHGGQEVALFCERRFGDELKKNPNFARGAYDVALKETFFRMDELLLTIDGQNEMNSLKADGAPMESTAGCTANVVLIVGSTVYIANAGDSRSILWTGNKVIALSEDHKPEDPIEKKRIFTAGGYIMEGRINGNLNLSRAIGDFGFKSNPGLKPNEQLISAEPDIVSRELTHEDQFIVMGCDGVWEILSGLEICSLVHYRLSTEKDVKLSEVVEEILDKSLAPSISSKFKNFTDFWKTGLVVTT